MSDRPVKRLCLAARARLVWANVGDEALDGSFTSGLEAVLMGRSKG